MERTHRRTNGRVDGLADLFYAFALLALPFRFNGELNFFLLNYPPVQF
jgi:hypothetical protein